MTKEQENRARELWEAAPSGWEDTLHVARQIVAECGDIPETVAYEMRMRKSDEQIAALVAIRPPNAKPYKGEWI